MGARGGQLKRHIAIGLRLDPRLQGCIPGRDARDGQQIWRVTKHGDVVELHIKELPLTARGKIGYVGLGRHPLHPGGSTKTHEL